MDVFLKNSVYTLCTQYNLLNYYRFYFKKFVHLVIARKQESMCICIAAQRCYIPDSFKKLYSDVLLNAFIDILSLYHIPWSLSHKSTKIRKREKDIIQNSLTPKPTPTSMPVEFARDADILGPYTAV